MTKLESLTPAVDYTDRIPLLNLTRSKTHDNRLGTAYNENESIVNKIFEVVEDENSMINKVFDIVKTQSSNENS